MVALFIHLLILEIAMKQTNTKYGLKLQFLQHNRVYFFFKMTRFSAKNQLVRATTRNIEASSKSEIFASLRHM